MTWLSYILSNILLAALIALAAWFVQHRLRRPALARLLWLFALIKLATPSLVTIPLGQASGRLACTLGLCGCSQHAGAQDFVRAALATLLLLWLIGAAATAWTAWQRWSRFRRLLSHAQPAPRAWRSLAARLALRMGLKHSPELLVVPGRLPPLVVPGWRRPRLVLPQDLMDQLNPSQKRVLLLHELAHIRRRDHLLRWLELAVRVVYWWLPGVRSMGRQLRLCEESCCDLAVISQLPHARRDYAHLLLDVLDFASPDAAVIPQATAMSVADDLELRLGTILNDSQVGSRSPSGVRTWTAILLTLGLACVLLPWGVRYDFIQQPPPPDWLAGCDPAPRTTPLPTLGCPD